MKPRKYRKPRGKCLEHRITTRVRFQEVDMLGMVWHGHYLAYFEDARVAFGAEYGLSYSDIRDAGLMAPMIHISCDFLSRAKFGDEITTTVRFISCSSPKIKFYYEVRRLSDSTLLATGLTVQAITDPQGQLMLAIPEYIRDFYNRWGDQMVSIEE